MKCERRRTRRPRRKPYQQSAESTPSRRHHPNMEMVLRHHWTNAHFALIEQTLGYRFNDRSLLKQAMSHRTATSTESDCYETLECIGDRTLKLIQMHVLKELFPAVRPYHLTHLEAQILRNDSLLRVCNASRLHELLNYEVRFIRDAGRHMRADMMEALFAAVDIDCDGARSVLKKLYLRLFRDRIHEVVSTEFPRLIERRKYSAA